MEEAWWSWLPQHCIHSPGAVVTGASRARPAVSAVACPPCHVDTSCVDFLMLIGVCSVLSPAWCCSTLLRDGLGTQDQQGPGAAGIRVHYEHACVRADDMCNAL